MKTIYKLIDIRDNSIKYIGQTSKSLERRMELHISRTMDKKRHDNKTIWLRECRKIKMLPIIEAIEEVDDNIADEREEYWINYYTNLGIELLNMTSGGKAGFVPSKESREKVGFSQRGKIVSKESKEKMRISSTGKKHSQKSKNKMSISRIIPSTGYRFISERVDERKNKFIVRVKGVHLGVFKDINDAINVRNNYLNKNNLEFLLPQKDGDSYEK